MARLKPIKGVEMKMIFSNYKTGARKQETLFLLPEDYSITKIYTIGKSRLYDYGMRQNDIEIRIGNCLKEKLRITRCEEMIQTAII